MGQQTLQFQSASKKEQTLRRGRDRITYTLRSYRHGKRRNGRTRTEVEAAGILVKLGLCAAACLLVLFIHSRQSMEEYRAADGAAEGAASGEAEQSEAGKLRFVELPGLLSVFSPDESFSLPLVCREFYFQNDNTLLCMLADGAQNVSSMLRCKVKETGRSEDGSAYVRLETEQGEYLLTGFSSVSVEEGQSLTKQDTLGAVDDGATLTLEVELDGKSLDLRRHFSLDGGV